MIQPRSSRDTASPPPNPRKGAAAAGGPPPRLHGLRGRGAAALLIAAAVLFGGSRAVQAQVAGDNALLARLHHELEKKNHPTVWEEMKRQRSELPEIDNLLSAVPFVLTW